MTIMWILKTDGGLTGGLEDPALLVQQACRTHLVIIQDGAVSILMAVAIRLR